jgi:hypothetical protein
VGVWNERVSVEGECEPAGPCMCVCVCVKEEGSGAGVRPCWVLSWVGIVKASDVG